jgi:hypothetical protein
VDTTLTSCNLVWWYRILDLSLSFCYNLGGKPTPQPSARALSTAKPSASGQKQKIKATPKSIEPTDEQFADLEELEFDRPDTHAYDETARRIMQQQAYERQQQLQQQQYPAAQFVPHPSTQQSFYPRDVGVFQHPQISGPSFLAQGFPSAAQHYIMYDEQPFARPPQVRMGYQQIPPQMVLPRQVTYCKLQLSPAVTRRLTWHINDSLDTSMYLYCNSHFCSRALKFSRLISHLDVEGKARTNHQLSHVSSC